MSSVATLTSLAMLKVRRDHEGTDYLDYLLPFVASTIAESNAATVTASDVQRQLKSRFGLTIPLRPVELVLTRLAKQGCLAREFRTFKVLGALPTDGFDMRRAEGARRLRIVVNHLLAFAETQGAAWNDEQAIDAFIRYLGRYSIECLKAYAAGSALPDVAKGGAVATYIVNAFIRNAHDHSTELFEDIMVFVESQMLSNALICNDLQANASRFGDVTFFLDTPLLIGLLGLDGPEPEALHVELMQLIKNLKGRVAVFGHTLEELDQVLTGCIQRFSSPAARSRIILYYRRAGRTATDLEMVRATIDDRLRDLRITVVPTPKHVVQFQIDESALDDAIGDEIEYFTVRALHYDVESIRSIFTLRQGHHHASLERSKAVLVTSNAALARVAYRFGHEHESTREVSTVITEMSLATIAWLKAPMGAPNLPRLEVLSACYAAMKPSRALFEKFIGEVGRLRQAGKINISQHELLRCSVNAHDELMRLTMGDDSRFSGHTVAEVIESVEREIAGKERLKFDVERERFAALASSQRLEVQRRLEAEQGEHERTRFELERLRIRDAERVKACFWRSRKYARYARIAAVTLFVGIAIMNIAAPFLSTQPGLVRQLIAIVAIVATCWDFARKIWSANAVALSQRFETWVAAHLFRRIIDVQGLTHVAPAATLLPPTVEIMGADEETKASVA
jgi:hypothetical protein